MIVLNIIVLSETNSVNGTVNNASSYMAGKKTATFVKAYYELNGVMLLI